MAPVNASDWYDGADVIYVNSIDWANMTASFKSAKFAAAAKNPATGKLAGGRRYVRCFLGCLQYKRWEGTSYCEVCGPTEQAAQRDFVYRKSEFKCEACLYIWPHEFKSTTSDRVAPYCTYCDDGDDE